ncbi:putative sugar phosphate isomerase YwlF [Caloramator mitchellensis]|uniref:Putative sugar phosphate isomerase YwlF n=1 Tax=Caloramator mitchellensis TaxID=908809 RepID=A0A0R3JW37_CALMK|nr:ribose 5-phosphate isomerase B [Caloramator mitchellensis]KRQ87747.1 putative sugar phosphate isomerase YwlF [Caloramator mitchellensis]
MKIAIASDHGGLSLKEVIKKHLEGRKIEVVDFGTNSTESCDYTDFALSVAEAVAKGEFEKGILVCGTGIGMSIAANKVKGIRAAHVTDTFSAKACVEHNNANIMTLGERITGPGLAIDIVEAYLSSEFQGGRHQRRIDKISDIENKYMK